MKSRNREVNIFNMSLLDILCGALGAFCFMMLVLFPYWRPGGMNAAKLEKQAEEMRQQMEELQRQLQDLPNAPKDILDRFQRVQQQLQQQQADLNRAQQDLEEKERQLKKLEKRNPIVVAVDWKTSGHDVDLYLHSDYVTSGGEKPPAFDPARKQSVFFNGEVNTDCSRGPCEEVWLMRDVPSGGNIEVCYKLFATNGNPAEASLFGYYLHEGKFDVLPPARFSGDKTGACVANLLVSPDYSIRVQPKPEYAQAYSELLGSRKRPGANDNKENKQ